jgi:hypothetical protein
VTAEQRRRAHHDETHPAIRSQPALVLVLVLVHHQYSNTGTSNSKVCKDVPELPVVLLVLVVLQSSTSASTGTGTGEQVHDYCYSTGRY